MWKGGFFCLSIEIRGFEVSTKANITSTKTTVKLVSYSLNW